MIRCDLISKIITYPNGSTIYISGVEPYLSTNNLFKQLNIKTIISVVSETLPNMNDFGIHHYVFYLQDNPQACLLSILPHVYCILSAAISRGENILVHCHAGVSRSVSVVIGFFLMALQCHPEWVIPYIPIPGSKKNWVDACLDYIRVRRPCANPNPGFVKQLSSLGASASRQHPPHHPKYNSINN